MAVLFDPDSGVVLAIRIPTLPLGEQERASHILDLVTQLGLLTHRFWAALTLFDRSDSEERKLYDVMYEAIARNDNGEHRRLLHERHLMADWTLIAARECAMSVYHYEITLTSIRTLVGQCPTFFTYIDGSILKAANKAFVSAFPHSTRMRNAVGHFAGLNENPEKRKQNSVGMFWSENLVERRMSTNFKKKLVYIDVTQESLDEMRRIDAMVYSAFQKASDQDLHSPLEGAAQPPGS